MAGVSIRGSGVAACCSARLLAGLGVAYTFEPAPRGSAPAVMLSGAALALMRDCLGDEAIPAGGRRITRRVVAWGGNEPVSLEHGATVLGGGNLESALALDAIEPGEEDPGFAILAAPPFPSELRPFGSRPAGAAEITLCHRDDAQACWIEAVESGWLFMIPTSDTGGWLLAVGGQPEELVSHSRHLGARIAIARLSSATFETAPRMLSRFAGPGWLACGTEAIAFDPICGDGTAQAVREAVLAVAVTQALADGEDPQALGMHYHSLLLASMRRHLRLCAQFYASGGASPWWQAQLAATEEGFAWCTDRLGQLPEPRYELRGLALVPRESVP